ncbi:MAG TPA: hypothetical protein PLQ09_03110 [Prolixibacteraceae bacterium]|nr:hypothetical protein [Prolixibacteraceae bacterium]
MISRYLKAITFILLFLMTAQVYAWEGMPMPKLHVEGRYLKDSHGHIVNLHGFGQTYSPWFNEKRLINTLLRFLFIKPTRLGSMRRGPNGTITMFKVVWHIIKDLMTGFLMLVGK